MNIRKEGRKARGRQKEKNKEIKKERKMERKKGEKKRKEGRRKKYGMSLESIPWKVHPCGIIKKSPSLWTYKENKTKETKKKKEKKANTVEELIHLTWQKTCSWRWEDFNIWKVKWRHIEAYTSKIMEYKE